MTVQFIILRLAKKKIMKKTTNATHNKEDSWSQWNAEFCECALHSTKQIITSRIETGIYKQISLYLIMSQQHVINHWEVNCSPRAKRRVCLILETNSARKINRHHQPNSVRARGSGFTWDKNYRGGDYGPPWLPDVTCSVLHSRDNYHINLINGHPGGRERQAELRRYSSQVRLFHLVSHEGDA